MDSQKLVSELNNLFWNLKVPEDELAHSMLELMFEHGEVVQFDSALSEAYRELTIWSRTEENTGIVLDVIHDLLEFKK